MESNDPNWTAGSKVGRTPDGRFVVGHHTRGRMSPSDVERLLVNTTQQTENLYGMSGLERLYDRLVAFDDQVPVVWTFGENSTQDIVLKDTAQAACVNFPAAFTPMSRGRNSESSDLRLSL